MTEARFSKSGRSWQAWLACEVARLHPEFAAVLSRSGLQSCARRQSEPREWGELLAAFDKAAVQNEQFDPAGNSYLNANARHPALQQNKLPGALVQYCKVDTRDVGRRREREAGGVDAHRCPVARVELPQLDEER